MGNRRRSKAEMKRVYFMRRLVAILLIVIIVAVIYTRCSKDDTPENNTGVESTTDMNETQPNYVEIDNNTEPIVPGNIENEDNTNIETGAETDNENPDMSGEELTNALEENERKIKEDYEEYADVRYEGVDHTFYFEFNGETEEMVSDRENRDDFSQFFENFRYDLVKTSETLAETVEPGIKLLVVDPKDDIGTLLLIQDGSVIFDATED